MTDRDDTLRQKALRRYEAWENSLDGISYNTHRFCVATSPDFNEEHCLVRVLSKLPRDVREFIQQGVYFVLANSSFPMLRPEQDLLVVLHTDGDDTEAIYSTKVAHEIAHVWLQYRREDGSADFAQGGLESEIEADDQCEQWGFGRAYESYQQFK